MSDKGPKNPWGPPGDNDKSKKSDNPWVKKAAGGDDNQKSLDETIIEMRKKLQDSFGSGGGNNGGAGITPKTLITVGGVIAVLWLMTGIFRVQETELGVVMRFGEVVRIASAGLQYHLPAPIEEVIIQNVTAVNTMDGAVRSDKGGESDQNLILTGDENMVHTNYTVVWKIKDVSEFLFTARQPEITIRAAAESVVREVIGQTNAKTALTVGRDEIGTQAQVLLQKLMDQYKIGVLVMSVQLQSVAPPKEVVDSFSDLQSSQADAERASNEAEGYRNDIVPRARGQAVQIRKDAEAYRDARIAESEGEAARFKQVYGAYEKNKTIALRRYHLDMTQKVLTQTNKVIFDPKTSQGVLPYLPVNELKKAAEPVEGAKK